MRNLVNSRCLGRWLLLTLLFGPTTASAQNCYQHQSAGLMLRECRGGPLVSCVDVQGNIHEIKIGDASPWKPADEDPECALNPKDWRRLKDAPPMRGQDEQDGAPAVGDW